MNGNLGKMSSLNHTHQYVRIPSRPRYYMCIHPQCNHILNRELCLGKESICNGCGGTILSLTYEQLKRARPKCLLCMKTKDALEFQKRKEMLEQILDITGELV